ncbi:MAG: bifunctional adenosylcobinamide kinase/adenosylcobinamide-phosphate guanylyltransferase [Oscillospiraceae bacterium]|nr:bifunctional adenosylcobinamide kinase/adenosylcobinamide-phosphate guanylyltransferase [Oscillospiraceae bacterium]
MELIIGGAYQGKLTYAIGKYGLTPGDACDLSNGIPHGEFRCCYHLEALTRSAAAEGVSADELMDRLMPLMNCDAVISREVGSGVVPMEPENRLFRELHGEVLRRFAREADSVTRIFCGIPETLK